MASAKVTLRLSPPLTPLTDELPTLVFRTWLRPTSFASVLTLESIVSSVVLRSQVKRTANLKAVSF